MANQQQIDLLKLFQAVAGSLQQNQAALNKADTYNHNHGDSMVQTFNVIVDALQKKQNASPAAQLAYAGRQVGQQVNTGSGQLYAKNLTQAATQFKGTKLNLQTILPLIQLLLGGSSSNSGDLLTSILSALGGAQSGSASQSGLGGLMGGLLGGTQTQRPTQTSQSADLGGLLGTLLGGSQPTRRTTATSRTAPSSQQVDLGGLLGTLLGSQTQQRSGSGDMLGSLAKVLLGGTAVAQTPHRAQSGEIVTNAILQALGKMVSQ